MSKKQHEAGDDVYVKQNEDFEWITTKHKACHIHIIDDHPLDRDDYDVVLNGPPAPATVMGTPGTYEYSCNCKNQLTNPKIIISS